MFPLNWIAKELCNGELLGLGTALRIGDEQQNRGVFVGFHREIFIAAHWVQCGGRYIAGDAVLFGDIETETVPTILQSSIAGGHIFRLEVEGAIGTIQGIREWFLGSQLEIDYGIYDADGGIPGS